jgi:hypothetical protein
MEDPPRSEGRGKTMTTEILLIGAGLLLVLGGIFGGFEVQQVRVPVLGPRLRVLSCSVGSVLLWLGFTTGSPGLSAEAPVRFVIFDSLAPEQIDWGQSEQASISIDGKPAGTLTVNPNFPHATLSVTVPKEGQHSFAIEAAAVLPQEDEPVSVHCFGTGMIDVRAGSRFMFEARVDEAGNCGAWLAEL